MTRKVLFLLYFCAPITVVTLAISSFSLSLSVAATVLCGIFICTNVLLVGGLKINTQVSIFGKILLLYYFVYFILLVLSFFYIIWIIKVGASITYFLTNFLMACVFILAFIAVVLSSSSAPSESVKTGLNGFFTIAAVSSIYGISCVFSLFIFDFDLELFLGQYFAFGVDYNVSRDWAIQDVFRGPGLSGINNSAIFYSSLMPPLFYFSFMQLSGPSKVHQLIMMVIILGCLVTMSRIGVFLSLMSIIWMLLLRYGFFKFALLTTFFGAIAFILVSQWIVPSFWLEVIETRLNTSSGRFALYSGAAILVDMYPLGLGLGQYYPIAKFALAENQFDMNIHSSWINAYLSLGPIYFTSLVFTLGATLIKLWSGDILQKSLAIGLINLMVAGLVNQVFENVYFQLYLGICFITVAYPHYRTRVKIND